MKPLKIDKYLDNVSQELFKIMNNKIEANQANIGTISINIGFYCSENKIEYKRAKEILNKVLNFMSEQRTRGTSKELLIDKIRSELLRICNSRSADEVFFYDNLRLYGSILDLEDNEDETVRKTIWKLEDKYWITIQEKGNLKLVKEITELNNYDKKEGD